MRSISTRERVYQTRTARPRVPLPAQRAAAQLFAINAAVGLLALATTLFVLARLAERWRVAGGGAPHAVSILGQRLSYPAANAGAVVVSILAAAGLVVLIGAVRGVVRELRADTRFRRAVARGTRAGEQGVRVIDDDRPQAFCAGLLHPRVYVSRGALELLDAGELSAVLAHERRHARCYDPLRLACTRVLIDALFFVPPLRELVRRQHLLAEIGADEAAVAAGAGDPAALASAMLSFSEAGGSGSAGVAAERVDQLVGEGTPWRIPVALLLVWSVCVAALVTSVVLVAETARGSATLALPFLSARPCIVLLALIPAGVALTGALSAQSATRPARVSARPRTSRS